MAGQASASQQRSPLISTLWLNLVEVYFSIVKRQALRRGRLRQRHRLIAAIIQVGFRRPGDVILSR